MKAARARGRRGGRPAKLSAKEIKTIRALLKTAAPSSTLRPEIPAVTEKPATLHYAVDRDLLAGESLGQGISEGVEVLLTLLSDFQSSRDAR